MKHIEKLLLENLKLYLTNGHSEIIDESTVTLDNDMGDRTIKVSVDPTTEAVVYMLNKLYPSISPDDDWSMRKLGGIKFNDEFCFWDRDDSSHNNVAYRLAYKRNFIGFYLFPVFDEANEMHPLIGVNVLVTKFSGIGKYDSETATEELMNSEVVKSIINSINSNNKTMDAEDGTQMN